MILLAVLAGAAVGAGAWWWAHGRKPPESDTMLEAALWAELDAAATPPSWPMPAPHWERRRWH